MKFTTAQQVKFSEEELSRILSAHEGGQLVVGGQGWWPGNCWWPHVSGCAVQVAKVVGDAQTAASMDHAFTHAFDLQYHRYWTADELLRWLESQGVA